MGVLPGQQVEPGGVQVSRRLDADREGAQFEGRRRGRERGLRPPCRLVVLDPPEIQPRPHPVAGLLHRRTCPLALPRTRHQKRPLAREDGNRLIVQATRQGWLFMPALVLRPALMLLGLILGCFVFLAAIGLFNQVWLLQMRDAGASGGLGPVDGDGGPGPEAFLAHMTNRYDAVQAQYGETHAVAAMMLAADDIGMTEWAQGFAQGVRILEGAWPTDRFVHEERRMVSLLARLAEGECRTWRPVRMC